MDLSILMRQTDERVATDRPTVIHAIPHLAAMLWRDLHNRDLTLIPTEPQLHSWASVRFDDFNSLAHGNATFDTTRRVLHTSVHKIEIDPQAKRGPLILPADLLACWQSEFSTRPTLGDCATRGMI